MPGWVKTIGVTLALVLGVRACLPFAVEQGIEVAGNRYLDGEVEVGDVDLGLLTGRLAIDEIEITRPTPVGRTDAPAIATLERFAVNFAPSALLAGRVRLEELIVEGGTIHLERSVAGDLVLPLSEEGRAALAAPPASEPEPEPDADFAPLSVELDFARFSDLHVLLYDPLEDVPSATFDLASTEFERLRVQGRRASVGRIAVVAPALLLDRGLVAGPRSVFRKEPAAGELEVAIATPAVSASPPGGAPPPGVGGAASGAIAPRPEVSRAADPPDARLAEVAIQEASFTWVDRTLEPVVREEVSGLSLVLNDLVWSKEGFANLEIHGEALRGEPFELTGRAAEEGGFTLQFVTREVDLTPFGPYTTEIAGYDVEHGRLSLDTALRAHLPTIESEHEVVLQDLRLSGEGFLEDSLGVGANVAVALLSGPDGKVRLKFPVNVDLSPEAVDAAIGSARKSVEAALHRSLEGVGSAGEGGSGLRFEPVASPPGQASLTSGQDGRIESLARLLREKPAVAVVLGGTIAAGDAVALAEASGTEAGETELRALAQQRVDTVRQALVEREVPARQVRVGEIRSGEDAGVRLELALASE